MQARFLSTRDGLRARHVELAAVPREGEGPSAAALEGCRSTCSRGAVSGREGPRVFSSRPWTGARSPRCDEIYLAVLDHDAPAPGGHRRGQHLGRRRWLGIAAAEGSAEGSGADWPARCRRRRHAAPGTRPAPRQPGPRRRRPAAAAAGSASAAGWPRRRETWRRRRGRAAAQHPPPRGWIRASPPRPRRVSPRRTDRPVVRRPRCGAATSRRRRDAASAPLSRTLSLTVSAASSKTAVTWVPAPATTAPEPAANNSSDESCLFPHVTLPPKSAMWRQWSAPQRGCP